METARRDFIKRAFYGLLALLGIGFLASGIKLFMPVSSRDKELVYFPLLAEDELPRTGAKKAELTFTVLDTERKTRVFVVSAFDGPIVLSATCSHLGCLVNYHKDKQEFVCPCHGGRYDLTGKNIAGPPPAPLTRLPVRMKDGMITVGMKV
jgi:nitrite reductase/ring-hydroxylating ferredoxin subunit